MQVPFQAEWEKCSKEIDNEQYNEKISFFSMDSCLSCRTEFFEYESGLSSISARGRLRRCIAFWESEIGASKYILDILKNGYVIPFFTLPSSINLPNNKSALSYSDFVCEAINDLISSKCVTEVESAPYVVNPLTVSVNDKGKKRLVLDLRHVNSHVWKEKTKYEDLKFAIQYFVKDGFMFSFDFKSGYHHIEIHKNSQQYLGFSWEMNGKTKYFKFLVLPFGLCDAGHVFTKVVRELVKHWRRQGIRIVVYLDDGIGFCDNKNEAILISNKVRSDVISTGFIPNVEKSVWEPVQVLTWLGHVIDLHYFNLSVPFEKVNKFKAVVSSILCRASRVTARQLAAVVGKVNSMWNVVGSVSRLMTRHSHICIASRETWDKPMVLPKAVIDELHFWFENIESLNVKSFGKNQIATRVVYSDASETGCAGYLVDIDDQPVFRSWSDIEKQQSSTWREVMGVLTVLESVGHLLEGQVCKWYTDNQNVANIVKNGSMKETLQSVVLGIFKLCNSRSIVIDVEWIPRTLNEKADYFSKLVDFDDWGTSVEFFTCLSEVWGPYSFDRFADCHNKKVVLFNSRFWTPGTEGVDAFAFDWSGHNNWIVPPISLIGKAIKHVQACKAVGTLIVPYWVSSYFWPLLCDLNGQFSKFVTDYIVFDDATDIFVTGKFSKTFFGTDNFKSSVVAIKLNCSM